MATMVKCPLSRTYAQKDLKIQVISGELTPTTVELTSSQSI